MGILKYAHDTGGTAVESLNLSDERERLERAQRDLSLGNNTGLLLERIQP